jgi:hypothetical protein
VSSLDEARAYLESRGLTRDIMIAAKLRPKGDRVWFPWLDESGNEVYSTGRSLNGAEPKYKHTPGERPPLYASPGAWQSTRVALVEGQLDALACAQAGTSAFATSGSSLPDAAVGILTSRDSVLLALDSDDAGRKLRDEVIFRLAGKVKLFDVVLPDGYKDLGDVAERADDPGEVVAELLDAALSIEPPWRTSWGPNEAEGEDEPPALMLRSDGRALLYAGKRHWFQGEPESGKTFGALAAIAEVLRSGSVALFIDFEDSRPAVVGRLSSMEAPLDGFVYVRPTEPLEGDAVSDVERLMAMNPGLVVVDGIAEAMALHGLDPVRAADTATFIHEVLDRFAGTTLVVIDHVARGDAGKGRYAYGSQHKLASVDGAAYRFEVIQTFSRDQGGAARIDVAKDRPGFVRSFALAKDRAGVLRVVPGEDRLEVIVEPPEIPTEDDGLTHTQRRVFGVLEDEKHAMTYLEIGDRLASDGKGKPLKRNTIKDAIDALCEKGLADGTRTEGGLPSAFWRTDGNRQ